MSNKLTVNVRQGKAGYEGTVQLPGLKSTKLVRKDGSTTFPSSSAVKTVARSVGTNLGLEVSYAEPAKKLAAKPKAAKKSAAKSTKSSKAAKPTAKKSAAKSTKATKATAAKATKSSKAAKPASSSTATSTSTNS